MGRDSYKKDYMQIKGSKVTCKENEEWITINLDSNPNLLAASIYLLNKLLDEQDVLPQGYGGEKRNFKNKYIRTIGRRSEKNFFRLARSHPGNL